ncbi:hypothetical protein ACWC4D_23885 [Streptomyces sp. NPDC001288]|uniref:hypothetical protein n=1 Tax=unclassified Streptomyces TaxID=2593676 RepID=UPI00331F1E3A
MMHLHYEVDVPIRNLHSPGRDGLHVFTGRADSSDAAFRAAHAAYESARAADEAGLEVPRVRSGGWAARGYRPGQVLDWTAATVSPWRSPYGWAGLDTCAM